MHILRQSCPVLLIWISKDKIPLELEAPKNDQFGRQSVSNGKSCKAAQQLLCMSCMTYLICIAENFYAAEIFYLHRLHFLAFCNYLQNEYKTEEWSILKAMVSIQYIRNCNACIQVFSSCNIIRADHSISLCRSMPK